MNEVLSGILQHGWKCTYLSDKTKTAVSVNKMEKERYQQYELQIKQFAEQFEDVSIRNILKKMSK